MAKNSETTRYEIAFLLLLATGALGDAMHEKISTEESKSKISFTLLNSETKVKNGSLFYPTAYDAINGTNGFIPQYEMPTNVYVSKVWYEYNSQLLTPATQTEEAQILMNGGNLLAIETSIGYFNCSAVDKENTQWIYCKTK